MNDDVFETIERLEEYLAMSALSTTPVRETIEGFGTRAREGGLSIGRLMLGWRLLNPLYLSQSMLWRPEHGVTVERYRHGEVSTSQDFLGSPVYTLIHTQQDEIRRRIEGANAPFDYPILDKLAAEGLTDYLALKVGFGGSLIDQPGAA